jgi:hypothetical protein
MRASAAYARQSVEAASLSRAGCCVCVLISNSGLAVPGRASALHRKSNLQEVMFNRESVLQFVKR